MHPHTTLISFFFFRFVRTNEKTTNKINMYIAERLTLLSAIARSMDDSKRCCGRFEPYGVSDLETSVPRMCKTPKWIFTYSNGVVCCVKNRNPIALIF